jgi:hypothetical protein
MVEKVILQLLIQQMYEQKKIILSGVTLQTGWITLQILQLWTHLNIDNIIESIEGWLAATA